MYSMNVSEQYIVNGTFDGSAVRKDVIAGMKTHFRPQISRIALDIFNDYIVNASECKAGIRPVPCVQRYHVVSCSSPDITDQTVIGRPLYMNTVSVYIFEFNILYNEVPAISDHYAHSV